MDTCEQMDQFLEFLSDGINFATAVNCLVNCTNGLDVRSMVYDMMQYLMTDKLQSNFNVDGRVRSDTEPKLGLADTQVYKLLRAAVLKNIKLINTGKKAEDVKVVYDKHTVKEWVGKCPKPAPRRCKNQLAAAEKRQQLELSDGE